MNLLMSHLLTWSLRITLSVAVLLILVAASLATLVGQRTALSVATYVASTQDMALEVSELNGSLFSTANIDRIALADRDGTWLQIRDIKLTWSPFSLLRGRINVEELSAASVELRRPPAGSDQPSEPSQDASIPAMRVTLGRMQVSELILGEAFAGTAARFEITASANLSDHRKGLAANLAVKRLDRPGAKLAADLTYRAANRSLSVKVFASEPAGGLIASLLQIPQHPALALEISGNGPLDIWQANWSVSASAQPFVAGRVRLDRDGERYRLATDFAGYIDALAPRSIAGLLAGKTTGSLVGHFRDFESIDVSHLQLKTDALRLRSNGGLERTASYAHGSLSLDIGREDQRPVEIALSKNEELSIKKLNATLSLPDQRTAREISLTLLAEGLTHPHVAVSKLDLNARAKQSHSSGATALDAENIKLNLTTSGFTSAVHGLAAALGDRLQLDMAGNVKSGTLTIKNTRLGDATLQLVGNGIISPDRQTGNAHLSISSIERFSSLLGEPVTGRADLKTSITANLNRGSFEIALNGNTNDLNLGKSAAAGLIGRELKLAGKLALEETGAFALQDIAATGNNLLVTVNGRYSDKSIQLDQTIKVADLSTLSPDLKGAARLSTKLQGTPDALVSNVHGTTQRMSWRGNAIEGLVLRFSGKGPVVAHRGEFELVGRAGERPILARALLTLRQTGTFVAKDVKVAVGRNTLKGHVSLASDAAPSASFTLNAMHLSDLDVLLGPGISGALSGELDVSGTRQASSLRLRAFAPQITFAGNTLRTLKATAALRDFMTSINGKASITLAELTASNSKARNLSLDLRDHDGRLAFAGRAQVNEATVNLGGSIRQKADNIDVSIDRADVKRGTLNIRLAERAQLELAKGGIRVERLRLVTGRGSINVRGEADSTALNMEAILTRVPTNIANVFAPSLGLDGAISGRTRISGSAKAPTVKIEAVWSNATAQALRDSHVPPATIKLNANMRNNSVKARVDVQGPEALTLIMDGGVTLGPAQVMRFQVSGDIPLKLANAALAARATQVSGRARISGVVEGRPSEPKANITINVPNAAVHEPSSGVKLQRVVGLLLVTERGLEIRKLQGQSAFGGTFSVTGRLARADKGAARVDMKAQLAQFHFNDRKIMAGAVDGNVALTGPLDALAAQGNVYLRRLDVTVPAAAPRSLATLNVKHINAPKRLATPESARKKPAFGTSKSAIRLNVRIDAANRIFVKGRGVDAQLGGGLAIGGTSDAPVTDGAFEMQRGRLDILGRRLDFRRGRILFDGAPEPVLDMEAVAVVDDVTVIVTISGRASKPMFKFSSNPELPEDEVIARLLFNKALVGLSPLQLVQLASEIDKLGGLSSGPSILDKLKSSVGVDVLDVSTDKTGAATVSAGRYVTDKTFVGVKQGATSGSSRVIIDHDFTKNLKARGEVGTDGNSKLGIGLEWDY